MDRETELGLIDELKGLKAANSPFLDTKVTRNSVAHYTSQARFDLERDRLLRVLPNAAAHVSELAEPGDFVRRHIAGRSILITRDRSGGVNAFLNVCRHRGTRLVDDDAGCKHRFSCPYHAWTYANSGELIAAPHFESGFPKEDKAALGLVRLPCLERFGFVWVVPDHQSELDINAYLAPIAEDLSALKLDTLRVAVDESQNRRANWKILVEGGIEADHFKVAHRSTIGPHFEDNLSSYRTFGPHMRSVLPRVSMATLDHSTRDLWRLRDHANVLYTLFPTTQLLVQQDHVVWIRSDPEGPDQTGLRIATLAPRSEAENTDHWTRNHRITTTTLEEDFVIGESIQDSTNTAANADMLFGRFEGALDQFNRTIAHWIAT